jgi:excisionase family DNA binding protein
VPRDHLTLQEVASKLGVHYMTAYRYVRTGRLPATRVGGSWQVDPKSLALLQSAPKGRGRTTGPAPTRARLRTRLVAGDEGGAWTIVESALASSQNPDSVLLELLAPALREIGTQWERGALSVADEHRASAVAERLVARLGARFAPRGVHRGVVILAAVPDELHGLPVAMAANLLRWRGFEVVELGANTPSEALIDAVHKERALLGIGLVCTTSAAARSAARCIEELRDAGIDGVPILLGGAGVRDAAHARRLGADVFTGRRADSLVSAVERSAQPRT